MLVWDLCLYVSNYRGTLILTFGCLLLSSSSCCRSAWFMSAFPGESSLLPQILTLDLFKGSRVSVVHSFESMLSDPELNSGYCTVCSVKSLSKFTRISKEILKSSHTSNECTLCYKAIPKLVESRSLWPSDINFRYLSIWLFPDILANPSQWWFLTYRCIIQLRLNEGLPIPATL